MTVYVQVFCAAALLTVSLSAPVTRRWDWPRTAVAVIYEADGTWGSVVFRQAFRGAAVVVEAKLHGVSLGPNGKSIEWGLFNEPVHYEMPLSTRCAPSSLKEMMHGGLLSSKHGLIHSTEFTAIGVDSEISLHGADRGFILQKSLVVLQGTSVEAHSCSTVYRVATNSIIPGFVPCEKAHYEDCTVDVGAGRCRVQACDGWRQLWKLDPKDYTTMAIDDHSVFCKSEYAVTPAISSSTQGADGTVPCSLGRHTGLAPMHGMVTE